MKIRSLAVLVLLLLIAFPCFGQETAVYQGIVQDKNGKAVSDAQVYAVFELDDRGTQVELKGTTTSDSSGKFKFESLPKLHPLRACYFVAYSKDNYLGWATVGRHRMYPTGGSIPITVGKLTPHEITAKDKDGNVIAAVNIELDYFLDSNFEERLASVLPFNVTRLVLGTPVLTGGNGEPASIPLPEHAKAYVSALKKGYLKFGPYILPDCVTLVPAGSLTGRLVNEKGEGIPHAVLHANSSDGGIGGEMVTDDKGAFSIDVSGGTYTIWKTGATSGFVIPGISGIKVEVGKTTAVPDIVAVPGVKVRAVIVDAETKEPIANAYVRLTLPGIPEGYSPSLYADSKGGFGFRSLPGKINLTVSRPRTHYRHEIQMVVEPSDGQNELTLQLPKEPVVAGTVVDEKGNPVEGAHVVVHSIWDEKESITGGDGRFSAMISCKDPAKVFITAEHPFRKIGLVETIDRSAAADSSFVVTAKPAQPVTVTVQDTNGKPIENADIKVTKWYGNGGYTAFEGKADNQGKLVIDNLYANGQYSFSATSVGYYMNISKGRVRMLAGSSSAKSDVTLVLEPANRVQRGKVIDQWDRPVKGAVVTTNFGPQATTDENGMFTMKNLPIECVQLRCGQAQETPDRLKPYIIIRLRE